MTTTQRSKRSILLDAFYRGCSMLEDQGIKIGNINEDNISINSRATSRWGVCKPRRGKYFIEIADVLVDDDHFDALLNTVTHELLHTVEGCDSHGRVWKNYARTLNRVYGLNIQRTNDYDGIQLKARVEPHHILQCSSCKYVWFYQRSTYAVRHPEACTCPFCHTKTIKRITEEYKKEHSPTANR